MELRANGVRIRVDRDRPEVRVELLGQAIVLRPCLAFQAASLDGAPAVPGLNTYTLAPSGPGRATVEDGLHVDASGRGGLVWVQVAYPRAPRPTRGSLGSLRSWAGGRALTRSPR